MGFCFACSALPPQPCGPIVKLLLVEWLVIQPGGTDLGAHTGIDLVYSDEADVLMLRKEVHAVAIFWPDWLEWCSCLGALCLATVNMVRKEMTDILG